MAGEIGNLAMAVYHLREIYRQEGWKGVWNAIGAGLLAIILFPIMFSAYLWFMAAYAFSDGFLGYFLTFAVALLHGIIVSRLDAKSTIGWKRGAIALASLLILTTICFRISFTFYPLNSYGGGNGGLLGAALAFVTVIFATMAYFSEKNSLNSRIYRFWSYCMDAVVTIYMLIKLVI